MKETKSTCCYCGVGCGVIVRSDGPRIIAVRGDPEHPVNFGRLCTKGANLHLTAAAGGRALHPELRTTRQRASPTPCARTGRTASPSTTNTISQSLGERE